MGVKTHPETERLASCSYTCSLGIHVQNGVEWAQFGAGVGVLLNYTLLN